MAHSKAQPSSPFVSREFNGEVLLDELDELRVGQVPQRQLDDCASALHDLRGPVTKSQVLLRALASEQFMAYPVLAALLRRWASRLKHEADGPLLAAHFKKIALCSALLWAMHRAAPLLPGRAR